MPFRLLIKNTFENYLALFCYLKFMKLTSLFSSILSSRIINIQVAEVEHPFRKDTRTEEEKILLEVEYILWVLSSKEEESDNHFENDEELISKDKDDVDGYAADKLCTDCATGDEENKTCMYSLEQLLSFPSLLKLCRDMEKLR